MAVSRTWISCSQLVSFDSTPREQDSPYTYEHQADRIATMQYNNNNYGGGGGYGQSNPYDNAPPPQYGMRRQVLLPCAQVLTRP